MHPEQIFLGDMDDIRVAIEQPTEHRILRCSAHLRKLLIDGNPLTAIVSRNVQIKPIFEVADQWEHPFTRMMLQLKPTFFFQLDGIDPETCPLSPVPVRNCSLDQFLKHRVGLVNGRFVTVYDVIDHAANAVGGVHFGNKTKTDGRQDLTFVGNFKLGGMDVELRQLLPLLRVVNRAMTPLVDAVSAE